MLVCLATKLLPPLLCPVSTPVIDSMTGVETGHSKNTETVAIQMISMSFQLFIADVCRPRRTGF